MNKRKILSLALGLCMVAILAVGGTLAYFVDTDAASNVFTTGNVAITLIENFGDNNPATPEKLIPATGSAQAGTLENGIVKEVTVQNNGTENAYVRVHIAIPALLDDGDPTYNAMANTLHFNYETDSIGAEKWDWSKAADDNKYEGAWNAYQATIDKVKYNVYVVTYGKVLASGETTAEKAMHQVYLDSKVTNDQIASINEQIGTNWQIKVLAEGAQSEGFDNAYDALNTAFGVPGTYDLDWSGAVNK